MTKNPALVDAYPTIAQRAAQGGHLLAYRVWLLARHCDANGTGWVEFSQLSQMLSLAGLNLSHYRTAHNSPSWAIFFKTHTNNPAYIGYRSDQAVRDYYSCASERLVTELSLRKDFKSLQRFTALNYAGWFANRPGGEQIISRLRLEQLWGASLTTLHRWEKLCGMVQRTANYGTISAGKLDQMATIMPRDREGNLALANGKDDRFLYQLPNSYTSTIATRKRRRRSGQRRDAIGDVALAAHKRRFRTLDNGDPDWQFVPDRIGMHVRYANERLWSAEAVKVVKKCEGIR